jgi:hypothetical protein
MQGDQVDEQFVERRPGRVVAVVVQRDNAMQAGPQQQADVRDYLGYVRGEASRLRVSGASADETAAAIEQDARARWNTWANPEWIGYAARAFHQASTPAARAEYQGGGSRRLP